VRRFRWRFQLNRSASLKCRIRGGFTNMRFDIEREFSVRETLLMNGTASLSSTSR